MKFLEVELEILSPTIVTERRSLRGFLKALDYIPASTLRGAILSELYRRGIVKESFLESERARPSVITSYAYPVVDGRKTYPAHPFMYECKICKVVKNYLSEVIEDLESHGHLSKLAHLTCESGHVALESLYSKPYPKEGKNRVPTSRFLCTGVSKERGTSEIGMLYEYEAIAPGRKFWATMAVPDELEEHVDGLEVRIGRGISRGFGRSRIIKSSVIGLRGLAAKIEEVIVQGKYIVFYASSPLVSCHQDSYEPYPLEVDLSSLTAKLAMSEGGKLEVKAVYGRADFRIGGWDMYENVEKAPVEHATRPGAIVVAKYSGSPLALVALSLLGTIERLGSTVITGVNMLHPARTHPIFKLGE
ncbi:RAMP superfamily CRISPR-associated protein [Thermofilum sp.]|uniref:RAMP superfamily CRISPR-associated protein n=1 Tax=Thermofilum sp. TaxID=1961369 RepID=UPI0031643330